MSYLPLYQVHANDYNYVRADTEYLLTQVLVQCWSDVFVTGIGSMLVFAGMNITVLFENLSYFGCMVVSMYILLLVLYFTVTYKPKWAGYDLVITFNHHFDLFDMSL